MSIFSNREKAESKLPAHGQGKGKTAPSVAAALFTSRFSSGFRFARFYFPVRFGISLCSILFFAAQAFAQPKDNSPYSRLGLGEEVSHAMSAAGFGGLSAAYADPFHVNVQNPASYGWLAASTFEIGAYGERSKIKTDERSATVLTGNLSHLALAFPMRNSLNDVLDNKKRNFFWGMNLALLPNTAIGYDIQTEEVLGGISDSILNVFQGTGGTSKLVWGNGVRYKNFSAGVNIDYIFGQLESKRVVLIQDIGPSYVNEFNDNISVRSLQLTFGFQYKLDLNKKENADGRYTSDESIIIGLYGNPKSSLKTRSTIQRIGINDNLRPIVIDTIVNDQDVKMGGTLPSEWTLGFVYQKNNKWRIGAEYTYGGWSKYDNEAKPETLFDSNRFAIGAEYSPDATSYNNYLKRVRYRAGIFYRSDPRLDDLSQYALTFGFGLPLILPRGKTSFVNLAFEAGRYHTGNQINENYMKMSLGFTLNDGTWFYKRKFR